MPRRSADPAVQVLRYFADAPLPAAQSILALAKEAIRLRVQAETPPPPARKKMPKKATAPAPAPTE